MMNEEFVLTELRTLERLMKEVPTLSDEYLKLLERYDLLLEINSKFEKKSKFQKILSNGPLISVLGTWGTALMVLQKEKADIIVSRAFGFIRPKI